MINIVGVVIPIQSVNDIVIRAGKELYHVFLARKKPEQLQQGDEVSVYGPRYGWNNIRSASIKIIKENPDKNRHKYFEEYVGTVAAVRSREKFELESKKRHTTFISQNQCRIN